MGLRRLGVIYAVIAVLALSIGVLRSFVYVPVLSESRPHIHDGASLPDAIRACGRRWTHDGPERQYSWAELTSTLGLEPVTVDPAFLASCPAGACTFVAATTPCHTVIWARVGLDAYVAYELSGGP